MNKIPPSVQMEKEFFSGECDLKDLFRKGAQVMLQKALEEEVTDFLGRSYHSKGDRRISGYRNGYEPVQISSGEGAITLQAPQVRDCDEAFISEILPVISGRTDALQRMIPRLFVKGMSTRDIEDVLRHEMKLPKTSRSVISKLLEHLTQEYEAWKNRDLSGCRILYLFVDGIGLAVRQGTDEKERVLAAYGITEAGTKKLLSLGLGSKESFDACASFFHDMQQRGLGTPLVIISDDAPGLRKAIKECFPDSLYQICQVHKMRNILCKLPHDMQAEMKRLLHRVFRAKNYEVGLQLGKELAAQFKDRFPSAMACLEKALPEVITCLKLPGTHKKRACSSNLIERLFGEGRRRTKVIPRFPTEKSCMTLFYATLVDASKRWQGVAMSVEIMKELDVLWAEVEERQKVPASKMRTAAVELAAV